MTARHWMQIAALTSTLGLTGAAIAQNTEGTTSGGDPTSRASPDTPSAGAIVTPEDKALGMGQDNERSGVRNGDANENESTSNDDDSSINPESSGDDEMSVNPGSSNDDESSVHPGPSNDDDSSVIPPPRTGFDANPGTTGAGSQRGR